MEKIARLEKIIRDLKSSRSYVRYGAMDDLMSIRDEQIIPRLFEMIKNESDFIKVQYCRLLGKMGSDLGVPFLVTFLLDKSEKISQEAASALEKIDSEKKNEALMFILRREISGFPRFFAIKSMASAKVYKAIPYLVDLLSSKEVGIKEAVIEACRQIGDPVAIRPLAKLLDDADDNIVYLALLAIGEIGDQGICEEVMRFLDYKSVEVRRAAVWALARQGFGSAIPKFIKMLQSESEEVVREDIVIKLGKIAGAQVVRPLLIAKAFDVAHNVRIYAEWALRDIPAKDKEAVFLEVAKDKDEVLRGEAVLEIGMMGDEKFFPLLAASLKEDTSEYVRASAAEGLSFIEKKEVVGVLKAALGDSEGVRKRVADSLYRCIGPQDIAIALDMAKGLFCDDKYIKEKGLKIIEKIYYQLSNPEEILITLRGMLEKPDLAMQSSVIKCLGNIGNLGTASFLKEFQTGPAELALKSDIAEAIQLIEKRNKKKIN